MKMRWNGIGKKRIAIIAISEKGHQIFENILQSVFFWINYSGLFSHLKKLENRKLSAHTIIMMIRARNCIFINVFPIFSLFRYCGCFEKIFISFSIMWAKK